MTVTPQGIVKLCQGVLENDYKNTLDFNSLEAQSAYFETLVKKSYTDYYYMKKDGTITVGENIDNIINCNYLFYKNNGFTTKTYYCFITGMEYISENSTRISFVTDVYQTWLFDFSFKASFIEREHVNDDGIGKNTVPENLELGENLIVESPTNINNYDTGTYLCMGVTEMIDEVDLSETDKNKTYNGIYSGLYYMIFTEPQFATNMIEIYNKKGKTDAINCLFLVPKSFAIDTGAKAYIGTAESISYAFLVPIQSSTYNTLVSNFTMDINNKLAENYTPINNKLFTFPYNYAILSNNNGTDIPFRYEDFINNQLNFKVIGSISQGCSIKCVPLNYKKISDNNTMNSFNFGINGGKFPICSWSSDVFTNWLVSNSVNIGINAITNFGKIGFGAGRFLGGDLVGGLSTIGSGLTGIANSVSQIYQNSLVPDQVKGNTNSGEITYSALKNVFTIFRFSIRSEYAKIIDNFFSMFGYKTNLVKMPNLTGRQNWNYVKTIDANIVGNIPQNDIEILKSIFNNGVTIWHNPSNFLDYTKTNNIV